MHKQSPGQATPTLLAGILVVVSAGCVGLLVWMSVHASIFWVALIVWLIVPVLPFAIRIVTLDLPGAERENDGIC